VLLKTEKGEKMRSKYLFFALSVCALSANAASADAIVNGQRLAATCAGCHGTNGQSAGGAIPGLVGRSKESIIARMQEFKASAQNVTIMHQLAKGYSDQQIEWIAGYLAQQTAQNK
jgi:sulfide dehydrogenase cytochrome subunit